MANQAKQITLPLSGEITAPKRKVMKAINVAQLLAKKYTDVELGEFKEELGNIEGKTVITYYGPAGSGKSVRALQLANLLAAKYGKTLYNSHEERLNKTLQDRVRSFNIDSPNLKLADGWDFDTLMERTKKNKYRVVVIDSVQYMKFTIEQFRKFKHEFRKRNIIVIMLQFGTGLGKPGDKDLLHASDVKVYVNNGKLISLSRYNSKPCKKTLFSTKQVKEAPIEFEP